MGHNVNVDVFNDNDEVIEEVKRYACDGNIQPKRVTNGVKWNRYIETNCIYSIEEIQKWCDFMCECGWKCEFSSELITITIDKLEFIDGKYKTVEKEIECYTITTYKKDYIDDVHMMIAHTAIRMIYYDWNDNPYEDVVKAVFEISLDIDPLEKLILAHYKVGKLEGSHGLFCVKNNSNYVYDFKNTHVIKLQNSKSLDIKTKVNETFEIINEGVNIDELISLMQSEKYEKAYKLIKNEK
jgi:hypothetical protein